MSTCVLCRSKRWLRGRRSGRGTRAPRPRRSTQRWAAPRVRTGWRSRQRAPCCLRSSRPPCSELPPASTDALLPHSAPAIPTPTACSASASGHLHPSAIQRKRQCAALSRQRQGPRVPLPPKAGCRNSCWMRPPPRRRPSDTCHETNTSIIAAQVQQQLLHEAPACAAKATTLAADTTDQDSM